MGWGRHVAGAVDPADTGDLPVVQLTRHMPLALDDMCGCGHLARDHSESYGRCARGCGCLLWHDLREAPRPDLEDQLREVLGEFVVGVRRSVPAGTQTPVLEFDLRGDPYPLIDHSAWARARRYVPPAQVRVVVAALYGMVRVQLTWLEDITPNSVPGGAR